MMSKSQHETQEGALKEATSSFVKSLIPNGRGIGVLNDYDRDRDRRILPTLVE
jgi:hypothetical protein